VKEQIDEIQQQFGITCQNKSFRILEYLKFDLEDLSLLKQICEKVKKEEENIFKDLSINLWNKDWKFFD
jgi:hypothetical protein